MAQATRQKEHQQLTYSSVLFRGKDEMNLCEFPMSRLGRNDTRLAIEYHGQIVDKNGQIQEQRWIVNGSATFGLPTEFAERVFVALMAITARQRFTSSKVSFTPYQVLKMLGVSTNQKNYQTLRKALRQLVGVTIYSEAAFWDKEKQTRVTTEEAFHILEKYWLRSFEKDEAVIAEEGVNGYIIWGETLWKSFESGYIKNLDTEFYYSLKNTLARRLYRFLDKRMRYQDRYQIDIFDLAGRLGMKKYRYASDYASKLKPSLQELIKRNFLHSAEVIKVGKFRRMQFVRPSGFHAVQPSFPDDAETASAASGDAETSTGVSYPLSVHEARLQPLYERYSTSKVLQDAWRSVLQELAQSLPSATYDSMLAGSGLLETHDGTAMIAVHPRSLVWVENRMQRQIRMTLNAYLETPVTTLHFIPLTEDP